MRQYHIGLNVYPTFGLVEGLDWRWTLVARNGRIIDASSEGFTRKGDALRNFRAVRKAMQEVTL